MQLLRCLPFSVSSSKPISQTGMAWCLSNKRQTCHWFLLIWLRLLNAVGSSPKTTRVEDRLDVFRRGEHKSTAALRPPPYKNLFGTLRVSLPAVPYQDLTRQAATRASHPATSPSNVPAVFVRPPQSPLSYETDRLVIPVHRSRVPRRYAVTPANLLPPVTPVATRCLFC